MIIDFCCFDLGSRSSYDIGRNGQVRDPRGLYLELDRNGRPAPGAEDGSPLSDNVMFDNQCYATTPSSSNGNSDQDQSNNKTTPGPCTRMDGKKHAGPDGH